MPKSQQRIIADNIAALQRRLAELERRSAGNSRLSYDRVEARALRWILTEAGIPLAATTERTDHVNEN